MVVELELYTKQWATDARPSPNASRGPQNFCFLGGKRMAILAAFLFLFAVLVLISLGEFWLAWNYAIVVRRYRLPEVADATVRKAAVILCLRGEDPLRRGDDPTGSSSAFRVSCQRFGGPRRLLERCSLSFLPHFSSAGWRGRCRDSKASSLDPRCHLECERGSSSMSAPKPTCCPVFAVCRVVSVASVGACGASYIGRGLG